MCLPWMGDSYCLIVSRDSSKAKLLAVARPKAVSAREILFGLDGVSRPKVVDSLHPRSK